MPYINVDFRRCGRYPWLMGRPPLHLKSTKVRLSEDAMARIELLVGNRGMAKFIREAIDEKLERDEAAKRED